MQSLRKSMFEIPKPHTLHSCSLQSTPKHDSCLISLPFLWKSPSIVALQSGSLKVAVIQWEQDLDRFLMVTEDSAKAEKTSCCDTEPGAWSSERVWGYITTL